MTTQTQPAGEEKKYFNLYLHGIGYLNNVRTITRNGQSYLKLSVAAIQGPADSADYTYFDCTVIGAEAKQLISHCVQEINSGQTVLACFTLSNLLVSPFIHQKSELRGQPGAGLTSNLLSLSMIKINGEVVYVAPPKESTSDVIPSNASETSDALDTVDTPQTSAALEALETPESTDVSEATGNVEPTDMTEDAAITHHAV
ncbi:DUF3577 domain-containing protein [Pseudomonas sp. FEN]|uniref:DUF3577 domain-containing protein n=1 Tax=Pseudomonas sp. FEN TaxID=2767468 RepID=UPI00174D83F3|nr:DUF3577 domain-containing protein [Pseudomonas sp. FEN]